MIKENARGMQDDTISREQAIDAVRATLLAWSFMPEWRDNKIIEAVEQLPSAQPEVVRCKDCKYGILDNNFPHQRFCNFKGDEWNNDDYFCGHAKKREVTT